MFLGCISLIRLTQHKILLYEKHFWFGFVFKLKQLFWLQEVIRIAVLNFKVSNLVGLFRKFLLLKVFSQRGTLQLSGYVCRAVQGFVWCSQTQVQSAWRVAGSDLGAAGLLPRFISSGDALHGFSCAVYVSLSQVKVLHSKTSGKVVLL